MSRAFEDCPDVTPEMAEAGALILEEHNYTEGNYGDYLERLVAAKIFTAMLAVSREQQKERP